MTDLPYGFHITGSEGDPIPTPSNEPPSDSRCHRCDGRGCEACDYRVLVMMDVGDDDTEARRWREWREQSARRVGRVDHE